MNSRGAPTLSMWLLPGLMLVAGAGLAPAVPAAPHEAGSSAPAVTATPPLQAVPAASGSRSVQQRMRGCNSAADARKLAAAAREAFIKSCMTPRRGHAISRPGSQPKADS